MARLQRKKQPIFKKRKLDTVEGQAGGPAPAPVDGAPAASTVKEVRKQSAPAPARRPAAVAPSEPKTPGRVGQWMAQALQFLREVKIELRKVTWPSRKQTIGSTAVVIILVVIVSMFLGVVDVGLSSLIRVVLQ
jgi:preprotein translocase subunit SecE